MKIFQHYLFYPLYPYLYMELITPILLIFTLIFNIFDTMATLLWVGTGIPEVNPILKPIIEWSPGVFVLVKLSAVICFLTFLGIHYKNKCTQYGSILLFIVYFILTIMHMYYYLT